MLTLKQYGNKIWAIIGDTRAEVALSFMRFQEFYENPIYKGQKGFTIQDIVNWQATISHKRYEDGWAGFNIPGYVILDVDQPEFEPFSNHENELLNLIYNHFSLRHIPDLYFIGVSKSEPEFDDILMHEIGHGLFKTEQLYREQQKANVNALPLEMQSAIRNVLLEHGYHDEVIEDETHAYMLTDTDYLSKHCPDLTFDKYTQLFVDTYRKFMVEENNNGSGTIAISVSDSDIIPVR